MVGRRTRKVKEKEKEEKEKEKDGRRFFRPRNKGKGKGKRKGTSHLVEDEAIGHMKNGKDMRLKIGMKAIGPMSL